MLTGFNTDFKYKGTVYHVQTEDNGVKNPIIITLLYKGGEIVASSKTSYADILKFERLEKVVKELMEKQHKQVIKDLVQGKFGRTGEGPAGQPETPADAETEAPFEPEAVSNSEKGLDEIILDYLSSEEDKQA